jgi:4-oxalocrotonate tautomerase
MPHVIVKLYAGRPEPEKARLAGEITKAVTPVLRYGKDSISVGIEDVQPRDWVERVYKPGILGKLGTLQKSRDLIRLLRDAWLYLPR